MARRDLFLWVWRGLGAALAVGALELAADFGETPLSLIPFVTSIALVLGMPEAEPAQPRALIGGHLVSCLVGFAILWLVGPSQPAAALGVGLALVAMRLTGTMHPPAGINPLLIVLEHLSPVFILAPVAIGAVLLAAFAFAWHRCVSDTPWPKRWL
ncbi:HPP family protein [Aquabacter spiritensis]|uniref:HPP family protein n=1 Tax=Aquabacter spiritensis TaxID=933073 RepID=A0A4R3LS77_9HYPH|nr:HPP family protein [Aquabacter spiritensis]TCT03310.1 HPP family protein [Aquabacter spiritensis]